MVCRLSESFSSQFLGPAAENAGLLEELLRCALADHVNWRRRRLSSDSASAHGEPGSTESDAQSLRAAFNELLQRLHGSVPVFSPHYNAHMLSEQTIAAQAAYFATMLYNPNNISSEVSPVTTLLESEVADQLATMIGYDRRRSWGHLTSGGTIANFEALWIARNVLYHPVAAAGVAKGLGLDLRVTLPDGAVARLRNLDLWQLLNLRPSCALDLWDSLWSAAPRPVVEKALRERSLATLGYQDYSRRLAADFGDVLAPGVVLATATGHYSWEKIVRALGIGANQLVLLPVDESCRMDSLALWETVSSLAAKRIPIMACVAVCGSTEESAIDRLHEIVAVRAMAERKLGVTFHIHADACYGGYAASITRGADNTRQTADQIRIALDNSEWPSREWVQAVSALECVDSVSIDPHKLGYVPYPAGAFLLKDRRARDLVAIDPPYLEPPTGSNGDIPFFGRFIFEGSKPGAAAAATWLNHRTMPLNNTAHGRLIASTIAAAHRLHDTFASDAMAPFEVVTLPRPDINIVCFHVSHPALTTMEELNAFNESIYEALSPARGKSSDYVISRTRLTSPAYDGAIEPVLRRIGRDSRAYWSSKGSRGIVFLRATVMNPFAGSSNPDYMAGLVSAICTTATDLLRDDCYRFRTAPGKIGALR